MDNMKNERKRAASHEAGHAIVAIALGGGFESIEIMLDYGLFPAGHIFFDEKKHSKLSLEARTIAHLGGLAGERVTRKTPDTVYLDGVPYVTVRGEGGDIAVIHEDISSVYGLGAGFRDEEGLFTDYIDACYVNAWGILQANKSVHRKLTTLLMTRDRVVAEDVASLMEVILLPPSFNHLCCGAEG